MSRLRALGVGLVVLALAACAPQRIREDDATLSAQAEREASLADATRWQLAGRIAVSNGEDGGNAQIDWRQDGKRYDLTLNAPVTGKRWRLHGDADRATLEGARPEALVERDAASLLEREIGWHVPVVELEYWVRGLRAPKAKAELVFDERNRPATLKQSGWTIEYRDWFDDATPALPRKVFATRGKYRVRLFVESWQAQ
ncbi:lipoprotein insertase outer membrane protein LolB [Tahibacter soli]|uniref:Outer-membrane lipoprotein LolB n=1 Tax=Tahibacter soli TaxID=2983605 RepID=A0A9X4BGG2_9GAMM|nr:lipoprotein insertase outer membrane protein LolB [Tahibacter soli]MDC8011501.1 lipoprotein insertase outer membrane protein LolB [Tahibacter soli]